MSQQREHIQLYPVGPFHPRSRFNGLALTECTYRKVEDDGVPVRVRGGSISASHDIYTGTVKILPEL